MLVLLLRYQSRLNEICWINLLRVWMHSRILSVLCMLLLLVLAVILVLMVEWVDVPFSVRLVCLSMLFSMCLYLSHFESLWLSGRECSAHGCQVVKLISRSTLYPWAKHSTSTGKTKFELHFKGPTLSHSVPHWISLRTTLSIYVSVEYSAMWMLIPWAGCFVNQINRNYHCHNQWSSGFDVA